MKPLALRATGLARFPEIDIDFTDGCSAVVGANASGKSTLLNAIELCLFADGSRDLAALVSPWSDRLEMELMFEHAGDVYRVRRGYRQRGASGTATVDFERQVGARDVFVDLGSMRALADSGWEPLSRESAKATEARIVETLGLSRATFRASAFLAQGDAAAFVEKAPAERKAILGVIFDPRELWPGLAATVKVQARGAEVRVEADRARMAEREEHAARLPELREASGTLERQEQNARAELAEAERTLETAQAAVGGNAAAVERHRAAVEAVAATTTTRDRAQADHAAAKTQADGLAPARELLAGFAARAATIPDLEAKAELQRDAQTKAEAAKREKGEAAAAGQRQAEKVRELEALGAQIERDTETAMTRLNHLAEAPDGTERCTVCEQLLGAEAKEAAMRSLQEQLEMLEAKSLLQIDSHVDAQAELERLRSVWNAIVVPTLTLVDYAPALREARSAAESAKALEVKIEQYEAQAAQLPALEDMLADASRALGAREAELAQAAAGMGDHEKLDQALTDARAAVTTRRARLEAETAGLTRLRERIRIAEQAAADAKTARAAIADAQTRLDLLRLAERAYGRDGIPALIAENQLATIETDANTILHRMPLADGRTLTVRLDSQRALKSSDAVKETLDVLACHDDTDFREVRRLPSGQWTFSGGEMFRISFALRWALAKLLAGRRGAESRLLVIDEPDGLDAGGMEALAVLAAEARNVFDVVLVVSHQPQLAASFENLIEVENVGGVSHIIGATMPEQAETQAVAA